MRRLALLLLLAACAPADPRPEHAYRAFVRAVAGRDAEAAYALLSRDTRAWLAAEAKAAAAAAPGIVAGDPKAMLIGDAALSVPRLTSAVVARETGDRALLTVAEEGGVPREVELVREKGWKVRIGPPRP